MIIIIFLFIFIIVLFFILFYYLNYLCFFFKCLPFPPSPPFAFGLSIMLEAFFLSLLFLLSSELLKNCGESVWTQSDGVSNPSLGDPQMSASVHLSLVLAWFFRKSAFGLCPSGRYSGKSTGTLAIQPAVFHSNSPSSIFNELLHPHLHCASLSVPESTPIQSLPLEGPPLYSGVGRGVQGLSIPLHTISESSSFQFTFQADLQRILLLPFLNFSGVQWYKLACSLLVSPRLQTVTYQISLVGGWVHGLV